MVPRRGFRCPALGTSLSQRRALHLSKPAQARRFAGFLLVPRVPQRIG